MLFLKRNQMNKILNNSQKQLMRKIQVCGIKHCRNGKKNIGMLKVCLTNMTGSE